MLLFYDIEVFKYDSLVVFKDIDNNVIAKYWSTRMRTKEDEVSGFEGIRELIKGNVLVGYNNYHYDDLILTAMMDDVKSLHLYDYNNSIIKNGGTALKKDPDIVSIDTMQQIDVSFPSLKLIEGNMGRSIIESVIDFNIDRPLSDAQRAEVEKYCEYDVESTIEVYKLRKKSYFDTKTSLIGLLPEDRQQSAERWNTTTISAQILTGGKKLRPWTKKQVLNTLSDYWRKVDGIPSDVWDMWESALEEENLSRKGVSKHIAAFGCDVVFGLGGLHGAPTRPMRYGRVLHADVGSMYPSIICKLGALGDHTDTYNDIRKERLRIKKTDKVKASALKLILNSVYGNFKNRYSALYNPRAGATVCIYGQIGLFKLCTALYDAGYEVINANTDGVVFVENEDLGDTYDVICRNWEKEFSPLILETDEYDEWIQKDVNNYVARIGDEIEVKGGEVNKYHENKFFKNNDCRIIQIAVVEKLVHGIEPYKTLMSHLDEPLLYQYVLKAGSTFAGTCDQNGNMMQKVNRVFACDESVPFMKLYKTRTGDDFINFPDVPERMYLWNGDLDDLKDFAQIVDLNHYNEIINKKLQGWPCT